MNNVSGIPSDIMEYNGTFYDKQLLELYYTYRTEAVGVITAHYLCVFSALSFLICMSFNYKRYK